MRLYHALCPTLLDTELDTELVQIEVYSAHRGEELPTPDGCCEEEWGDLTLDYWGGGRGELSAALDVAPVPLSDVGIDDDSCLPLEATELVASWSELAVSADDGLDTGLGGGRPSTSAT